MDTQEITKKLEGYQTKADSLKQQKSKLEGELESLTKRKEELEAKSLSEIGVPITELGQVITEQETKINTRMAEIAQILGGEQNG